MTFDHGKCAEAFKFYETVFAKKTSVSMTYGNSPMAAQVPKEAHGMTLHTSLELAPRFMLMGCDRNPVMHKQPYSIGNHVTVSLTPKTHMETERLFEALAKGGQVLMPLGKQFWGSLFGTVTDQYGVQWMFDYPLEQSDGDNKKDEEKEDQATPKHSLDKNSVDETSPAKKAKA